MIRLDRAAFVNNITRISSARRVDLFCQVIKGHPTGSDDNNNTYNITLGSNNNNNNNLFVRQRVTNL